MEGQTLTEARDTLVAAGITGPHRSHSRRDVLYKIRATVEGDADASFGLSSATRYSASEVLGFLGEITGCSVDLEDGDGADTIDPDRTMAAILAAARRLRASAARGATMFAATGHPTGLLEHHMRVVDAFREAGGKVLRSREAEKLQLRRGRAEVRYVGGIGCLSDGAALMHTHSSEAMEALLDSDPWPDLVLADHGFAGAAIQRGIPTLAIMDINDPALAIASAEGDDVIVIPMDDNRPPRLYKPSWTIFERVIAGDLT